MTAGNFLEKPSINLYQDKTKSFHSHLYQGPFWLEIKWKIVETISTIFKKCPFLICTDHVLQLSRKKNSVENSWNQLNNWEKNHQCCIICNYSKLLIFLTFLYLVLLVFLSSLSPSLSSSAVQQKMGLL